MKNGKISESVLKRSVLKQLHTKSDRILFKPAVGEDCAVISMQAGGQTKLVTATQTFTLDVSDKHVRANCAVYDALNNIYAMGSGGYVELSYMDFCRRRQADQSYMDKLFIPVQGCLLEVVREQYAEFYKDKERWRYLKKLDTNHSLLSLEGFTDNEGNVIDFVVDETVDVAETVVHAVMVDRLKAALPLLSGSEQTLIQAIFFEELSEREVGLRLGVTQSVVNKRKSKILAKLRKIIENKI